MEATGAKGPKFIREPDNFSTEWELKNDHRIVIKYLTLERLDALFDTTAAQEVMRYKKLRNNIVRIAEFNKELVGAMLYRNYTKRRLILMDDVLVRPDWRRRYVGTALIRSILRLHRAAEEPIDMYMHVDRDNVEARFYLQENGFIDSRDEIPQYSCPLDHTLQKLSF